MAKKEPDRVCSDCIHFCACQSWTNGILDDTDARPCRNYETPKQSSMYYLGRLDADKRNKPTPVKITGVNEGECPVCGGRIDWWQQRYCRYCGQALDWRDD